MTGKTPGSPLPAPVRVGLLGSGGIGAFHGESIARRIAGTELAAVADPAPGAADWLAAALGCGRAMTEPEDLISDPAVEAVVIAAPPAVHADLVEAAAEAGKAIFCEKPMALILPDADRAIEAASAAGVPLQVGFNRRFASDFEAARDLISAGELGRPQLMRSLTRDPILDDPSEVKPWTIFLETLIHDFDTLCWLNPGSEPVEVYATADALVRPDYKDQGLLDTAVVNVRFDNGALATAEASLQAVYGYDVRGEVFGSAGMVTAGDVRRSSMAFYGARGVASDTTRHNTELFRDAYTSELEHFAECVRIGTIPRCTGEDARRALGMALAAIESVKSGRPARLEEPEVG
jgi:myo-inositol 2-dehydrogenase / D-chiro-inositol 1-dehydrogenase